MRRLWKIIKENFPVALAMATTFLSIVYAGMRLMIYVYWMGYFKELNIDANILEINYEGNLFQVIFYGGIILLIVYIYGMLDETYKKVREQIRNKEGTWLKKLFFAIGVVCSKRLLNQAVGKSLRTHNLKPKKGAQVMRKNEKITALYERLSRDDFGKDDDQQRESNSISNQKAMLEEFAARQGFTNIVHFTDDGISGTCFVEVR